jgi:hypothetical protein
MKDATEVIEYDGEDPYQMIQVHDYLNVKFFRMDLHPVSIDCNCTLHAGFLLIGVRECRTNILHGPVDLSWNSPCRT